MDQFRTSVGKFRSVFTGISASISGIFGNHIYRCMPVFFTQREKNLGPHRAMIHHLFYFILPPSTHDSDAQCVKRTKGTPTIIDSGLPLSLMRVSPHVRLTF
jgi:hypothetical protein